MHLKRDVCYNFLHYFYMEIFSFQKYCDKYSRKCTYIFKQVICPILTKSEFSRWISIKSIQNSMKIRPVEDKFFYAGAGGQTGGRYRRFSQLCQRA